MAVRYRKLDPRCWDDERFVEWDDGKRNLWLLLLLGPAVEVVPGLQTGGVASLAETLRRPYETVREQFTQLLEDGRVQIDERFRLIRVIRAPRFNQPANPNQVLGWFTSWCSIPESPLKYLHIASIRAACELSDSEYSPPKPKPKKGARSTPRASSPTPFMDAFLSRFGSVDVDSRITHLNDSTGPVETVHVTVSKTLQVDHVERLVGPSGEPLGERLPQRLGDHACARTRARTHNDLDLDLGSGSGSGAGGVITNSGSGGPPPDTTDPKSTRPSEVPEPPPEDPPTPPENPPKPVARKAASSKPKSAPKPLKLNGEPAAPEEKRKRPLPDDWKPNAEHVRIAAEEGRDLEREAAKFRDDAQAKRKLFVRWNAAFNNWLRNDIGRAPNSGVRRAQVEPDWQPENNPEFSKCLCDPNGECELDKKGF